MDNDYEYLNCTCSVEQQEWQERVVKALIPLGVMLRDSVNRFNQQDKHVYTLDEEVTVDIITEWLKYYNSFQLLLRYGKFDVSISILRSLLELTLQLSYLLINSKEIKAAYYFISFFIKGHQHNETLYLGRKDDKSLEILRKNNMILSRMKNHNDSNAQRVYKILLPNDRYQIKDAKSEWYKLYFDNEVKKQKKERFSMTKMLEVVADELDPTRLLLKKDTLYGTLSMHTHGLVAPMNVCFSDGVQYFKPFENTHYAGWILDVIVQLTQLIFLSLRAGYPDFDWPNDEELIHLRDGINDVILEWAEKFKE